MRTTRQLSITLSLVADPAAVVSIGAVQAQSAMQITYAVPSCGTLTGTVSRFHGRGNTIWLGGPL